MTSTVDVAVIPVAGLGTRWLPVARSTPKELIPVWRDSASSYVVAEAIASGIKEIVFVTSPGKMTVPNYFQRDHLLASILERQGKRELIAGLEACWDSIEVRTVVQDRPLGLGHAILCAQPAVAGRPFAVLLPDEILFSGVPATRTLYDDQADGAVLMLEVEPHEVSRYGIAALEDPEADSSRITGLVEKPATLEEAPSRLALIGRYVLPPSIFKLLATQQAGHGGEIQLTDAIARLAEQAVVVGKRFEGQRHDVGQPLGHLMAAVHVALQDPELGARVRKGLSQELSQGGPALPPWLADPQGSNES